MSNSNINKGNFDCQPNLSIGLTICRKNLAQKKGLCQSFF